MPKSPKRMQQVAELLQQQIALLISREINDPRLKNLSITDVNMSDDLSLAKVYYTLFDEAGKKDAAVALKKATGFLRKQLASHVQLRYVPNLRFVYDDTLESAERISRLLEDVEDSATNTEDE